MPLDIQGVSGEVATLTPKLGFQFVHLSEDGFADIGASGFDLSAGGHGTDSFQPYLAVAAAQKFIIDSGAEITPELRLGYAYEALSNSRLLAVTTASGADFPVTGVAPSRNQVTAGIGLSMVAGPNLSLLRRAPADRQHNRPNHPGRTARQILSRAQKSASKSAIGAQRPLA